MEPVNNAGTNEKEEEVPVEQSARRSNEIDDDDDDYADLQLIEDADKDCHEREEMFNAAGTAFSSLKRSAKMDDKKSGAMMQRTKIVFIDSSDDEDEATGTTNKERPKAPPKAVVQTVEQSYQFTMNEADLLDDSERDNDGLELIEDTGATGGLGGEFGDLPPELAAIGASSSNVVGSMTMPVSAGFGTQTRWDLEQQEKKKKKKKRPRKVVDQSTLDETWLEGKKKKFEEEDGENDAEATAEDQHSGVAPRYNLTLNEADVQDEFSDEEEYEGGEEEEEDEEELDDEEEEERLDRVIAVAAVEQAVKTVEEDEEFQKDVRYQAFVAKAKEHLTKLYSEQVSDDEFIEEMDKIMLHLKRVHSKTMRPPKNDPIIINGVLTDL